MPGESRTTRNLGDRLAGAWARLDSRPLVAKIARNKLKFALYLLATLTSAFLASRLLGDHFDVAQQVQKFRGPSAAQQADRNVRQVNQQDQQQQQQQVDPFAGRPRIATRNGHLVFQASQDKNIDFRTSGARGSVTVNGLKLDQLMGAARALERLSTSAGGGGLVSVTSDSFGLGNESSSTARSVQERHEMVLRTLFGSAEELKRLGERQHELDERLEELSLASKQYKSKLAKRLKQMAKWRDQLDEVTRKLKENNCLAPLTGLAVCKNGAECIDLYDSYKCLCPPEFEGAQCQLDVDECAKFRGTELGCQNGGRCVNLAGGYKCDCPAAFHGVHCTERHDDCALASSSSMCGHGKCVNLARSQPNQPAFECLCDQGWTTDESSVGGGGGRACVVDINECLAGQIPALAVNGSAALQLQQQQQLQVAGGNLQAAAYPCSQWPWVDCVNLPGSFACGPCPRGYQGNGRVCRDIDECLLDNGGCSPLVECTNLPGSRKCGPCPPGYATRDDSQTCERLGACQLEPNGGCHPMAKCVELRGVAGGGGAEARLCDCQLPFVGSGVGPFGCSRIDSTGTAALPGNLSFTGSGGSGNGDLGPSGRLVPVIMAPGGNGTTHRQDDCHPDPCLNEGLCLTGSPDGAFECLCAGGWQGRTCELPAREFACGGAFPTSAGLFQFPVSAADGSAQGEGATTSCVWSIAVPASMSVKLDLRELAIEPGQVKRRGVSVQAFNLTSASSSRGRSAPAQICPEYLDVRERLEGPVESAGASGRLLARICVVPLVQATGARQQSLSLVSESNLVELEYHQDVRSSSLHASSPPSQRAEASASADTPTKPTAEPAPALHFKLAWAKTEPACGGELPIATAGSISSPRFPEFYAAGTECRYLLRVPAGQRIRMQFGELNLLSFNKPLQQQQTGSGSGICADSLTILDGALAFDRPVLFRHCANEQRTAGSSWEATISGASSLAPLVSSSSTVELILVSRPESSVPLMRPKQKRGFYLTYAAEASEPACGGLYTAKAALIKSLDYEPGLQFSSSASSSSSSTGGASSLEDAALAYEYANYFDLSDNSTNYFNYFLDPAAATGSSGNSPDSTTAGGGGGGETGQTWKTLKGRQQQSKSSNSSKTIMSRERAQLQQQRLYKTRCEYEIRPADQARNHRVQLDWLEMPSELPGDSMSSLSRWSRRMRCLHSRLLVFDGHPAAVAPPPGNPAPRRDSSSQDRVTSSLGGDSSRAAPQLLATFCAGDKYNASMPQLQPLASTGHLLFLVYEALDEPPGSSAAGSGNTIPSLLGGGAANKARGFRLHYSTRCSAIYRQPEGEIQTELDAEVTECLYHIVLPLNNSISLQIEPMLLASGDSAADGGPAPQELASLVLPDGSCAVQAVFMDGAVPRGPLALAQTERQLRFFDFSTGGYYTGSGTAENADEASPSAAAASADSEGVSRPAAGAGSKPSISRSAVDLSGGGDFAANSAPDAGSATPTNGSDTPPGGKYAFWQYGSSRVHDIKEFDVCHLPALGFDASYNEISLMFRLNPKLVALSSSSSSGGGGNRWPEQVGQLARLKLLIKYSSETACGGILPASEREGSLELVASRYSSHLNEYFGAGGPLAGADPHAQGFLAHLFTNKCSWILRNPRPGQQIQLTFERVPTEEIRRRMSDWIAWLRSGAGADQNRNRKSSSATTKRPASGATTTGTTSGPPSASMDYDDAPEGREAGPPLASATLANCSLVFQELLEFYEPATGRSRLVCPSELVEQPSLHWTTLGDTVAVRLLNDTGPRPATSLAELSTAQPEVADAPPPVWPGRKPLGGPPIKLNYVLLAQREQRACGGKLMQSSGAIQTPRHPFNYAPNSNCVWILQAPRPDQQVRLNFTRFHMEEHSSCMFDFLEIRAGPTERSPLVGRFCGRMLQGRVLITQSSIVWLRFRSDAHLNRPGFRLLFDAAQTGCGGLLTAARGQIDSPNYPLAFAHGADCEWAIEVAAGNRINLQLEDLDLSGPSAPSSRLTETSLTGSGNCTLSGPQADYLEVFDVVAGGLRRSLGRWCHLSQVARPRVLRSSSNRLRLVYRSQPQDTGRGFRLTYTTNCTFERELTGLAGVIESPGYPGAFDTSHCSWVVRAPLGANLSVAITDYAADESYASDPLGGGGLFAPGELYAAAGLRSTARPSSVASSSASASKKKTTTKVYDDVRPLGGKCPGEQMQLRFWSARVENSSVRLNARLESLSSHFIHLFERKQARAPNMTNYYNFSRSLYNFTLERNFCTAKLAGASDGSSQLTKSFEVPSNVLIVHQQAGALNDQPRRFRLEWRARQACGGALAQQASESHDFAGVHFDERLNLTRWQASRPTECLWTLDGTAARRQLEFVLHADMRPLGGAASGAISAATAAAAAAAAADQQSASAACNDSTSLTLYDGLTASAPVLLQNCGLDRIQDENVLPQSGQLLVRYLSPGSSGSSQAGATLGRNFALYGWVSHKDGCSVSTYDVSTPHMEPAGTRTSPNYPDLYEAKRYRCSGMIASAPWGRMRFTIAELDIPLVGDSETGSGGTDVDSTVPLQAVGFSEPKACTKSGSYLRLRSNTGRSEVFCGKFESTSGLGSSTPGTLERSVVVFEEPAAWLEFHNKAPPSDGGGGGPRGRWKVSYDRLCGAWVRRLAVNEEFATPNYPERPAWPASASGSAQANERVCVWRISLLDGQRSSWRDTDDFTVDSAFATTDGASSPAAARNDKPPDVGNKLLFNLMDFIAPTADQIGGAAAPLATGANLGAGTPRDCLRLYEGYNISLARSAFNLTQMDAQLEPKLRICSQADLKHSSMLYMSRGSELVVMTTGLATAKFRVRLYENHCGGDFLLRAGQFATPNFPAPYAPDLDCHYFIFGSPGARIKLRFSEFDLPAGTSGAGPSDSDEDSSDRKSLATTATTNCDSSDYVELRQITARQRVQLKLRSYLASRSHAADSMMASSPTVTGRSESLQLDVGEFLSARNSELGTMPAAAAAAANGTQTAIEKLRAIRGSLNRLLELAHLFYLFEELPESSMYAKLNRVRGQNSRLSIKLEDFYAASTLVGRYCGNKPPKLPADLLRDEVLVRFRSHSGGVTGSPAPPRGFLADYKLNYGSSDDGRTLIKVVAPSGGAFSDWDYLSSPGFPERSKHEEPLALSWSFETQLDHLLEFELISLALGSAHRDCQTDARLSLYNGLKPAESAALRLVRWCGHLSFKHLLDRGMERLWAQALEGSLDMRRLPVSLAHEPQVQAALLRRVRTRDNLASLTYDVGRRERGAFLLRYRAIRRSVALAAGNISSFDAPETPLEADEALTSQFGGGLDPPEVAGPAAGCSRIYKLALGGASQLNDSAVLSSPNWPAEVQERELECHWLVTTSDNTNIALQFDPSALATEPGSGSSSDYCFKKQSSATTNFARNFVVVHDGASTLAPVLARYCLPAPPVQLASTGRHLLVRYVHAEPQTGATPASASGSDQTPLDPDSTAARAATLVVGPAARSSTFSALAHVGRCGGQYHILQQASIRDGLSSSRSAEIDNNQPNNRANILAPKWQVAGERLSCLYFLFASDTSKVLTIHGAMSSLKFAQEPSVGGAQSADSQTGECPLSGDYLEVRELPLQSEAFDFSAAQATTTSGGRSLGRFCASRRLPNQLESPGAALVLQFKTTQQQRASFDLLITSGEPRHSCPRTTLKLTPEEPHARLVSPGWPHGLAGARRCKYHLTAPRGRTLQVSFVRLARPLAGEETQGGGVSGGNVTCLDSLSYLDDSEAASARFEHRPLAELRAPISGTQLRKLVKQVECISRTPHANSHNLGDPLSGLSSAQARTGSGASTSGEASGSLAQILSDADYRMLAGSLPTGDSQPAATITSVSDNLLLEYAAKNLQPLQGFVALVSLADARPPEMRCGGEVEAVPGRNLLESARFGQPTASNSSGGGDSELEGLVHCHWGLKFDGAASRESSVFGSEAKWLHLDALAGAPSPASEFKTSFLVFAVLELAPAVQNTSLFEDQYGNYMESRASELCGLNRLLIADRYYYQAHLACGYLTHRPEAAWLLLDESTSSEVIYRSRNLERVVYGEWYEPPRDSARTQLEGRTKLHRGMRAFFYETACPQAERAPGDLMRLLSHSGFRTAGSGGGFNATGGVAPSSSYQPGICRWSVRLKPGYYEISLRSLNLRKSTSSNLASKSNPTKQCDDLLDSDYLEVRASSEPDAPLLARYCQANQLEAGKHSLPINSSMELTILFVAGLAHLRQGQDKFPGENLPGGGATSSLPVPQPTSVSKPYGFEVQVTKVANSSVSEFCRRESNQFNIYRLIRNRERTLYYGSDYYSATIAPNSLYPRNTHCSLDMSLDDNFRFNLTFPSFFDLEPSRDCLSGDYLEISDLVEKQPKPTVLTTTTKKPSGSNNNTNKPKTVNRRLPTTTTRSPAIATTASSSTNGTTRAPTTKQAKAPIKVYEKVSLNLYRDLEPKLIGRWCGRNLPRGSFLSSSSKIRIVFHSNERVEGKGFILEWSAVPALNQTIADEDEDQ